MIKRIEITAPNYLMKYEKGYEGAFTRATAFGALPNGTRVKKVKAEDGDHHKIGAQATILGSMREPDGDQRIFYFVEWDLLPKHAVGCMGWKLEKI